MGCPLILVINAFKMVTAGRGWGKNKKGSPVAELLFYIYCLVDV